MNELDKTFFGIAAAVLVFGAVGSLFGSPPVAQPVEDTPAYRLNLARGACEEFVRRSLNDPGSAEFTNYQTWYAREVAPLRYRVIVELRARNQFNALVKTAVSCDTTVGVKGDWFPGPIITVE